MTKPLISMTWGVYQIALNSRIDRCISRANCRSRRYESDSRIYLERYRGYIMHVRVIKRSSDTTPDYCHKNL